MHFRESEGGCLGGDLSLTQPFPAVVQRVGVEDGLPKLL